MQIPLRLIVAHVMAVSVGLNVTGLNERYYSVLLWYYIIFMIYKLISTI